MVTFVILHYNNLKVTEDCIMHLLELNNFHGSQIVLIDNNSPNGSGQLLFDKYKNKDDITVLLNTENLGFAKGNNIGYLYAKEKLNSDTIIVMNNDVLIEDRNFLNTLNNDDSTADIIAPDIVNLDNVHQNPFRQKKLTSRQLKKIYYYNYFLSKIYRIPVVSNLFLKILFFYKNSSVPQTDSIPLVESNEQIVPHGSCVIFRENWIIHEDFAFVPVTFMYFEEDILAEYIERKNYKVIFNNELQVKHLEDASFEMNTSSAEKKKRQFIADNMVKSGEQLLKIRKQM